MTLQATPVLALRNLSKTFGATRALGNVDLTIERGEIHGLLGENGSGKSTLIKILNGFHVPDPGGSLRVNGTAVPLPLDPGEFRRLRMAFVHQDLALIPSLTVVENLRIGPLSSRHHWRLSWRKECARASETLNAYAVDVEPHATVADLKPVDCALLAVVRAIEELRSAAPTSDTPGLLVLDEPTPFLPLAAKERVFALITRAAASAASVLLVSHDLDDVSEVTDRVTVLRDGQVAGIAKTAESTRDELAELVLGRSLVSLPERRPAVAATPPAIRVDELSGNLLTNVSFTLRFGEVLGIAGLQGSGFEDIPYYLFGAKQATSGVLEIRGRAYEVPLMTPPKAMLAGIGLVPGDRQCDGAVESLTVGDNVMLGSLDRYAGALGLERGRLRNEAGRLLKRFDVRPPDPTAPYEALSGGNQQKTLLAKWLQLEPTLLLLHEPTQGVDIAARQQVIALLGAAASAGAAVVNVSADYDQLASTCDRVLVFGSRGRIRELIRPHVSARRIAQHCYGVIR